MSAILEHGHRGVRRAAIASAAIVAAVVVVAAAASLTRAQSTSQHDVAGPGLTVSIISPANGAGAPGQTLQAGVFAITNNVGDPLTINSITIAFSMPSLFSSATLKNTSARFDINGPPPGPSPVSPPLASTTFTSGFPVALAPGSVTDFALEVTLSPMSRNEPRNAAYATITTDLLAAQPLWIAFAILGLAMAAMSEGTRRRAWFIAGLVILFAIGAPGCGGDSSSGPSSTQTVTAVSAEVDLTGGDLISPLPAVIAGLPLKIGTIFGR